MKKAISIILACALVTIIASATSWRPRTLQEKVEDSDLIVSGVASLEGERKLVDSSKEFGNIYRQNCRIFVREILWPKNSNVKDSIVIPVDIRTNWPAIWWSYNNTTGVFFFVKTEKCIMQSMKDELREIQRIPEIHEAYKEMHGENYKEKIEESTRSWIYDSYSDTTKQWSRLEILNNWYESSTNTANIRKLIKELKK